MREYETGATRDNEEGKFDYEGFLSPLVLERYATYMHKHRQQADGKLRASDNWQFGIPLADYMKSKWRHFMDTWKSHRAIDPSIDIQESLCAELFNTMGYLHETIMKQREQEESPKEKYSCGKTQEEKYSPWKSYNITSDEEFKAIIRKIIGGQL